MGKRLTAVLISLFVLLSAGAVLFWRAEGTHSITGDEPHYLVIADGLLPAFELEQTGPYSREFSQRRIVRDGLAKVGAVPSPANTHGELGPRGLFNVHNLGLPILLAIPFAMGGEMGARFFMVLVGACLVYLLTRIASLSRLGERQQFAVLLPVALGLPFVTGATQIYPDLPAGTVCLAALYLLLRGPMNERKADDLIVATLLAYLPWLHIRFALPMAILAAALIWLWRERFGLPRTILRYMTPLMVSVGLLAAYNWYAFGHFSGPYQSGDVMLNRVAIMQFIGLFLDQNQGLMFQQPLHLVGLFYASRVVRQHPVPILAAIASALSMIGPNATHWNLYGGWSLNGRFGWGAATILTGITILAVLFMWSENRRAAVVILCVAAVVQMRHLFAIFIQRRDMFPHAFDGWIGTYSVFWQPIEKYLPQWRDHRWAFDYLPNLVFLSFVLGILIAGSAVSITPRARAMCVWAIGVPAVFVLLLYGRFGNIPLPPQQWTGSVLPGLVGRVEASSRAATTGDKKGFLTFGPFWPVTEGEYEVGVRYSSSGSQSTNGVLDVYLPSRGVVLMTKDLGPTSGVSKELHFMVRISGDQEGKLEIRTTYEGTGSLRVDWIALRHADRPTSTIP